MLEIGLVDFKYFQHTHSNFLYINYVDIDNHSVYCSKYQVVSSIHIQFIWQL